MKYKNPIIAAALVCAISALLAWSCGYNFDVRNNSVGFWVFLTILYAVGAALAVYTL